MLHEKTADRAVGQWPSILAAIGVPSRALVNKHGPCPMCGGKDRFRFDNLDGRGTFFCSQCGNGDGIKLVMLFLSLPFKDAAKRVDQHIGEAVSYTPKGLPTANDETKRQEMRALWERSKPITSTDAAGLYLNSRTGLTKFPSALRFVADERYVEAGKRPSFHPAMVAKVDPSDEAAAQGERPAIHRTYLAHHGDKADVGTPRKMMGTMPTGAAVRLAPAGEVLGIAEGIETAISAQILFNVPTWAALTADLLEKWTPPACVRSVFIFGDHDASYTGQTATFALAKRLTMKGIEIIVHLAPAMGQDWNDVLMCRLEATR